MLDEAERNGHAHIISWLDGGQAFKIHKPDSMMGLLNSYFSQSKYKSFIRQLQTYGFTRVTKGPDKGTVSHPLLIQGKRYLCVKMKRKLNMKSRLAAAERAKSAAKNNTQEPQQPQQQQSALATPPRPAKSRIVRIVSNPPLNNSLVSQNNNLVRLPASTSAAAVVTPMKEPLDIMKAMSRNLAWPMPGMGNNNCLSLGKTSLFSAHQPLPMQPLSQPTNTVDSDSTIKNILDHIDDDLCDYFTSISENEEEDLPLPSTTLPSLGLDDEDDEWLKGITYDGADIMLEPDQYATSHPPANTNVVLETGSFDIPM